MEKMVLFMINLAFYYQKDKVIQFVDLTTVAHLKKKSPPELTDGEEVLSPKLKPDMLRNYCFFA